MSGDIGHIAAECVAMAYIAMAYAVMAEYTNFSYVACYYN